MHSNEKIADLIFKISRSLKDEMIFTCFAATLSMLQLHTLIYLKKRGPVGMSDIASEFHIELPTATSLLNKLVNLKLVKRQAVKNDRRIVQVVLTEKGNEVLQEAWEQRNKKMAVLLSFLDKEDKQNLQQILEKLLASMEKRYEK